MLPQVGGRRGGEDGQRVSLRSLQDLGMLHPHRLALPLPGGLA
jgi:hypothetical protein